MMLPPPIPTLFPYTTLFRSLEVGRDPLQRLAERVEQRLLFGLEARNPLEAGEEIGRDRLVAVNVHGEVDAGLLHLLERVMDLGATLQRRRVPFAVEVHARSVGAQVAAARSVRIHVRDDVERRLLAQP